MRRLLKVFSLVLLVASLLPSCDGRDPLDPSLEAGAGVLAARGGSSEPAAPSNLNAVVSGDYQISVTWQDNSSNETRFEVFRSSEGAYGPHIWLAATAADTPSYTDTNVNRQKEHCYQVRAVRVAQNKTTYSSFSNTRCVPVAGAPAAPSQTTSVVVSASRIDITWQDNSSDETRFEIQRVSDGYSIVLSAAANTVAHSDSRLTAVTQYCYSVRAVRAISDSNGSTSFLYSSFSNAACATTPLPSGPPASRYELSARPSGSGYVSVVATWTDTSTPPPLRVYRSTNGGTSWELIATLRYTSRLQEQRPSEQQACYRAVAYNEVGDGPQSNTACTVPPAAPTNLTATAVSRGTIDLTWSDNSAVEDGYQVWMYTMHVSSCMEAGGSVDEVVVAELPPNATTFRADAYDLTCHTHAWYYVVAKRDGGTSDTSEWIPAANPEP